jgi:hypothetical protein
MDEKVKLKRGGQPGNRNARKHGFYASVLDEIQKQALKQAAQVEGLDDEIGILRLKLKSVVQHDPENVRLISQAAVSLARLLRTRNQLGKNDKNSLREAMQNVIRDIVIPLGLDITRIPKPGLEK